MDTNTQTLLRLIAKAEVAKNRADEAQRVADIKARAVRAIKEAQERAWVSNFAWFNTATRLRVISQLITSSAIIMRP